MKITQVRNATLLLDYAGTRFLIDPMLSAKGAFPGFEGTANSQLRNPLVELPLPRPLRLPRRRSPTAVPSTVR